MTCEERQMRTQCGMGGGFAGCLVFLCVLVVAAAGWIYLYLHSRAMDRAYRYNAHVVLREAWQHYRTYGTVTNPNPEVADVFSFTNYFNIQGTDYKCILGMLWGTEGSTKHLLGITEEGITLWLENTNAPEVMEFNRPTVVPKNPIPTPPSP
jgi:hypothetical protein